MRIFRIGEPGAIAGLRSTARQVLVRWEDGSQETVGVPDAVGDAGVADFIRSQMGRPPMGWKTLVPKDTRPQVPPD